METILRLTNVHYQYDEQAEEVLKGVTLDVKAGEWVALVGSNGSGKSTLSRLIDGLLIATEGQIEVCGLTMNEENVWAIREQIGMVFQNPDNQFVGANVEDDVAFGLENRGICRSEMKVRVRKALEEVEMWEFRKKEPSLLSGGQKQRVALAGVLAITPKLLILDEAMSMLDPEGRKQVLALLKTLRQKYHLSILSITHDIAEMSLADRLFVLEKGTLVANGKPETLLLDEDLVQRYHLASSFALQLKQALRQKGIDLEVQSLDLKEWEDALWKYMEKS